MELYLDTSDVVAVKALSRIFPLAGVTTNPSIIAAGKKPLEVVLPELHEAMGSQRRKPYITKSEYKEYQCKI